MTSYVIYQIYSHPIAEVTGILFALLFFLILIRFAVYIFEE